MKLKLFIFILCTFLLILSTDVSGQVVLDNNYKCILSEIPGRGHGLTNGIFTFYIDAKSRDLVNSDLERKFLLDYRKTKDNLYFQTGKRGDLFFYEIVIPESLFVITLTSISNNTVFSRYSILLLNEVRKNRNSVSQVYFVRRNRKDCPY